ncbi:10781_t:CDS:2 [Rhizophagus irregularis]|nr:10781_t:CDS:2 [Rhizophagus irregularis]
MKNFPTEVVQRIVSNLQDVKNPHYLFSTLMVNKEWCKVSVPYLWELTLDYIPDKYNSYKCIITYLSNAEESSRNFLRNHGMDLLTSPPWSTFNYPTYLTSINYHHLAILIQSYLSKTNDDNNDDFISAKERLIFQELFKLFMKKSKYIKKITIPDTINLDGIMEDIPFITRYNGASKCLRGLKEFYCYWNFNGSFYKSILNICKNIQIIKIYIDAYYDVEYLSKLISIQSNLKQLKIEVQEITVGSSIIINDYCTPIFNSILDQKNSIQKLELINFSFQFADKEIFEKLINCKYLRFLSIYKCKFLESLNFSSLNEAIIINCPNLEILKLSTSLNRKNILDIFSSCNQLKYFSFKGNHGGNNENNLLIQMSKFVPLTLEILEIQMCLQHPWIFSADSLKFFLKASKNLKLLKIIHKEPQQTLDQQFSNPLTPENSTMKTLSREHFDVIKESGIGLYMTSGIKFSKKLYPNYVHTIEIPRKI